MTQAGNGLLEPGALAEQGPPEAIRLPLELIDPDPRNPRRQLRDVGELADSILEFGLIQPIAVRRTDDRYQLISGHRRLAAFQRLQQREPHQVAWRSIPATIHRGDEDRAYLMLITAQAHIESWAPREQAAALERLAMDGMTLRQIGDSLHRTEGWVSRRLRVFADATLSAYVQTGRLTPSIAELLLTVQDPAVKKRLAEEAATQHLNQDQVKGRVRALRLDMQLSQIGRLARSLVEALSAVDPADIPVVATRDLWTLHGRIEVLSGARQRRMPTVEEAQRAAHVNPNARPKRPVRRTKLRAT